MEEGKKRKRELPEGYTCHACGLSGHAIYECELYKKKVQREKKLKFFMWGLSPTTTNNQLEQFLTQNDILEPSVKLVINRDNNKCKGVGFITVSQSEKDKLLALDGSSFGTITFHVKEDSKDSSKKSNSTKRCYRCGEKHDSSACPNQRICYRCKSTEHISSDCPLKKSSTK